MQAGETECRIECSVDSEDNKQILTPAQVLKAEPKPEPEQRRKNKKAEATMANWRSFAKVACNLIGWLFSVLNVERVLLQEQSFSNFARNYLSSVASDVNK